MARFGSVVLFLGTIVFYIWLIVLGALEDYGAIDINHSTKLLGGPFLLLIMCTLIITPIDIHEGVKKIVVTLSNLPILIIGFGLSVIFLVDIRDIEYLKAISIVCLTLTATSIIILYFVTCDTAVVTVYYNKYTVSSKDRRIEHVMIELARVCSCLILVVTLSREEINALLFLGLATPLIFLLLTRECMSKVMNTIVSILGLSMFILCLKIKGMSVVFEKDLVLIRVIYSSLALGLVFTIIDLFRYGLGTKVEDLEILEPNDYFSKVDEREYLARVNEIEDCKIKERIKA